MQYDQLLALKEKLEIAIKKISSNYRISPEKREEQINIINSRLKEVEERLESCEVTYYQKGFSGTNDDIKANDGWPLGWNVGDYYSNAKTDNPTVLGEGYGENANGFVLPAENGDVWVRTVANVKKNTDYLFKVRVKHSDALAGTTVSVEGPNNDENASTTRLGGTWPGGTSWSDVEIKFNSGKKEKKRMASRSAETQHTERSSP